MSRTDYILRDEAQSKFGTSVELFTRQLTNKLFIDSLFTVFTESSVIDRSLFKDADVLSTIKKTFIGAYEDINENVPVQLAMESGKIPQAISELYESCRTKATYESDERFNYDGVIETTGYDRVSFESHLDALGEVVDFVYTRQEVSFTSDILLESTIEEITTVIKTKMDSELKDITENQDAYKEIADTVAEKLGEEPEPEVDGPTSDPTDPTPAPTEEDLDIDDDINNTNSNTPDTDNAGNDVENNDEGDGDDNNSDDDITVNVDIDTDNDDESDDDTDNDDGDDESDNDDDDSSDEDDEGYDEDEPLELDDDEDSDEDDESEEDDGKKSKKKKKEVSEESVVKHVELVERVDYIDSFVDMQNISFESTVDKVEFKRRVKLAKDKRKTDQAKVNATKNTAMTNLKKSGKKGEEYKKAKEDIIDKFQANSAKIRKIYQYSTSDAESDTNGDPKADKKAASKESVITFESKESKAEFGKLKAKAKIKLDKAKVRAINTYDVRLAKIKTKFEGAELKIQVKAAKQKRNDAFTVAKNTYKDNIAQAKAKTKAVSTEDMLNGISPLSYLQDINTDSKENRVAFKLSSKRADDIFNNSLKSFNKSVSEESERINTSDLSRDSKITEIVKIKGTYAGKINSAYNVLLEQKSDAFKRFSSDHIVMEKSFDQQRSDIERKFSSDIHEFELNKSEDKTSCEAAGSTFAASNWETQKIKIIRSKVVALETIDKLEADAKTLANSKPVKNRENGTDYDYIRSLALEGVSMSVNTFRNAPAKFSKLHDYYKGLISTEAVDFDTLHNVSLNAEEARDAVIALENSNPGEYTGPITQFNNLVTLTEAKMQKHIDTKVILESNRSIFQEILIGVSKIYEKDGSNTSDKAVANQVLTESTIYYNILEFMNSIKLLDINTEAGKEMVDGFLKSIS